MVTCVIHLRKIHEPFTIDPYLLTNRLSFRKIDLPDGVHLLRVIIIPLKGSHVPLAAGLYHRVLRVINSHIRQNIPGRTKAQDSSIIVNKIGSVLHYGKK